MSQANSIAWTDTYRCLLRPTKQLHVILIGCGGTGSHLAQSLAAIAYHAQAQDISVQLTFIDGDTVEPHNVGRQRFCSAEADAQLNKAVTLAWRLNAAYGLKIVAVPHFFTVSGWQKWSLLPSYQRADQTLLIGCVDNHIARQAIATVINQASGKLWWLDCGNARYSGQILIGNCGVNRMPLEVPRVDVGLWHDLPAPHVQEPVLLEPSPEPAPSCAEAIQLEEQSLSVNVFTAALAAQYVQQFVLGRELSTFASRFNTLPPLIQSELLTEASLATFKTKRGTS